MKIVGRGAAVFLTEKLVEVLKDQVHFCDYQIRYASALNKKGNVVDEVHVMMTMMEVHESKRDGNWKKNNDI